MKHHFVRTENHGRLSAAVAFMEERGSASSCLMLLHGEPGVGKTRNISHWGAAKGAVLVKGHVGMNLDGLRWAISEKLGVKHRANRSAEMEEQIAALRENGSPIVFDEAQFGLSMRCQQVPAAGIEYLRDVAERGNTYVVLVCHNSEVRRFSDSAHIRTRIAHRQELFNATVKDTVAFVQSLCEVSVSVEVAELVHKQTDGKFRLVENAIAALERIARVKQLDRLEAAAIAGVTLVVDHELTLVPKVSPRAIAPRAGGR